MYHKDRTTVKDRRELLRVKLKSLAAEAKIIRREEQRTWGPLLIELHHHRVHEVRQEARATHLAYGIIRGVALERMEKDGVYHQPLKDRVARLVKKYGPLKLELPEALRPSKVAAAEKVAVAA